MRASPSFSTWIAIIKSAPAETKFTIMVSKDTVPGYIKMKSTLPKPNTINGIKTPVKYANAIKLTNKFQKKEKSLDKGKKMCGKALKTRLIFRGRAHEIHS